MLRLSSEQGNYMVNSVKVNPKAMIGVIMVVALSFLFGCADAPRARLAQVRTTLSAAEETMIALNDAEVMSDRAMLEADVFVKTARLAIDGATNSANGESPADFEQYLSLAEAAIKRLMAIGGDNPLPDKAER